MTIPSIQSPVVAASGSYSSSVKVPSAARAKSRLATCPCWTQLKVWLVQFGEKTVVVPAFAVIFPRVAVCTVTVWAAALTVAITPVTSSTKSNSPVVRLVEVAGSELVRNTFAAARLMEGTPWPLIVMALARLTLMASPVC